MQLNMHDLYDSKGKVKAEMAASLTGHKHLSALLPNLQLLNQHLHSSTDIVIEEEAQAGLYFSFLGTGYYKQHTRHSISSDFVSTKEPSWKFSHEER
ncbi:hypothetical protein [Marinomonas sp. GJ51-6]|uniref:hypothetical protein n=1 Tax=Marinomonas sp. GJ51-6 TaxID=2992802 RepID=UPI002934B34A|nr:hypothetical protein [Marinomonas sp. GJ51-6]WOD06919.1 hypothetical protein ONZ50_14920 [Marinomonas sp. GJ51-6]